MNLNETLFLAFILFTIILILLWNFDYTSFSSFFLAFEISIIVLVFIFPPTSEKFNDINSGTIIYFFLVMAAFVLLFIYSFTMALNDKIRKETKK